MVSNEHKHGATEMSKEVKETAKPTMEAETSASGALKPSPPPGVVMPPSQATRGEYLFFIMNIQK